MELRDALFAALRYELAGNLPKGFSFEGLDGDFLKALYGYANRQEVAHLVGDALDRLGVLQNAPDEVAEPYRRRMAVSAYHAEQQRQIFETVSAAFDEKKIPYLPLKGLVIRPLYPEPWMRSAGDLDILVKQEDLERASEVLTLLGGVPTDKEEKHDRPFFFATGVMLELHYRLLEDERANGAKDALDEIWEHTERPSENRFEYRMEDAWFYYYHLVHAAKHLEEGTCGIRPFLDLWVINRNTSFDPAARRSLLEKNRLLPFAEAAEKLSEVWLSGKAPDEWTQSLEAFLLAGGTFGTMATKRSMTTSGKGGKLRYYLKKIFLPASVLKKRYPILEKHPFLLPLMQVKRWFHFLFCGGIQNDQAQKKEADHINDGLRSSTELKKHLGL